MLTIRETIRDTIRDTIVGIVFGVAIGIIGWGGDVGCGSVGGVIVGGGDGDCVVVENIEIYLVIQRRYCFGVTTKTIHRIDLVQEIVQSIRFRFKFFMQGNIISDDFWRAL